jgi:uncharacterized protein YndB with AHSA1/START domain
MPTSQPRNQDTFRVDRTAPGMITMTRLFDAPRHLVFEAMTRPEHVRRWWGILDDGYSVPVCEIDLRPGGRWRFVGQGPRGQAPDFYGEYREITPPERLVYTEIFAAYPDVESLITTVLTEEHGKTRLTVTCEYPAAEIVDMVMQSGMEKGAAISYDRLDDLAAALQDARASR